MRSNIPLIHPRHQDRVRCDPATPFDSEAPMHNGDASQSAGRVAILLACYNGEKHLDEQLRSIFAQTYDKFLIIARDDGSADGTPDILARWAKLHPDKMVVVSDNRGNLRHRANFSLLMEGCDAPYFAFCDQDDVWLPGKLQLLIEEIRCLEARHGKSAPILVHSDLKVVDDQLQELYPSYFAHRRFNLSAAAKLPDILFTNVVTGCAMMGNRALLELARPIPDQFRHHDWWLGLVAASCGVLKTIPVPTVLYRQHGQNAVGAGPPEGFNVWWDGRHVLQQPRLLRSRMGRVLRRRQEEAFVLLSLLGNTMSDRKRELVRALCLPLLRDEMSRLSLSRRVWRLARYRAIQIRVLPAAFRCCY